jgi:hypothetical protein
LGIIWEIWENLGNFGDTCFLMSCPARNLGLHHIFFGEYGKFWEFLGILGTFEKILEIWEQLLKILEKI